MHHAIVYTSPKLSLSVLPADIQVSSADVSIHTTESLKVEDVRDLKRFANQRPVEAEVRTFVIVARALTREAQNALLKILEEPPASSRFVFVIPHEQLLLGTVRSRVHFMHSDDALRQESSLEGVSLQEKIATITLAAKNKDKAWLATELSSVLDNPDVPHDVRLLIATYKDLSGSSKKMLLELAALHIRS